MNQTATAQHTPGPWTNDPADGALIDARVNGRIVALAEVFHVDTDGVQQANARLIAAAPRMLEIIRSFVEAPAYSGHRDNDARAILREVEG